MFLNGPSWAVFIRSYSCVSNTDAINCKGGKYFFYVLLTVHLDIIVKRKTNLIHNLIIAYYDNLCVFRA
jgi:hypothetical protein